MSEQPTQQQTYAIYWHDAGDEQSGAPIEVEASSLRDAYDQACKTIKSYGGPTARRFSSVDIEFIKDAAGERHYPQFFL